jgi:lysophospholipase L1-like esterase
MVLVFLNCNTTYLFFKKETKNYHHPDFQCFNGEGFRSESDFQEYLKFWAKVRLKIDKENQKIKSAPVVIVGNSLVFLFHSDLLRSEFPGRTVVNRGIGGDTTDTLLMRIEEDAMSLRPNTLILEIGGNDLIQGKCLSRIQNNIHSLIQKIRSKLPKTKIIIISVPPVLDRNLNAITPIYNAFLSTLPKEYKNLVYLETWQYLRDENRPILKEEFWREEGKDKIHMNDKAYSVWGKLIRPHL